MVKQAQPKSAPKDKSSSELRRAVLDVLYEDMYARRRQVYAMNFARGIFFGLGSAIGGTLVIAIAIWTLNWFVDWPLVGEMLQLLKAN